MLVRLAALLDRHDPQLPSCGVGVSTDANLVLAPGPVTMPLHLPAWAQGALKPDKLKEALKVTAPLTVGCCTDQKPDQRKEVLQVTAPLKVDCWNDPDAKEGK